MNWQHLNSLLWLRWRLSVNQTRRHGSLNLIILSIAGGLALVGSSIGFFVALFVGMNSLREVSPAVIMYLCDGWLLAFLFFWMIGVMSELQRGEMLSLDKLLHLPTTLTEVFTFNFLSSLVSLTTLTFVPPMLGLCIAAVVTRGPASLVMFPLVATFVLMVCAVTYQFRGWLATLMTNKRRQRTVIVFVTFFLVLVMQTPQLINLAVQRQFRQSHSERRSDVEELNSKLKAGQITPEEFQHDLDEQNAARDRAVIEQVNGILETLNLVLPIGWLAYGGNAAASGNPWPGLAGSLGMAGIAALSLRRSYRTTLQYFTGGSTGRAPRLGSGPEATVVSTKTPVAAGNLVEWSLPFVTEPVAAVAYATFRSLTRAPEIKLALLGPVIMLMVFGAMLFPKLGTGGTSQFVTSLMPLGVLGMTIMGLTQLSQNLFAFDRAGFRAYVLSGVPRQQILFGKNLALAPLVFVPALLLMTLVQLLTAAPAAHFMAALLEIPTVFLLMCLLGNSSSIRFPIGQAAGSMKPANASGIAMLLQFLFTFVAIAILALVAVVPLATEWLLQHRVGSTAAVPIALIVATLELAGTILLYRTIIGRQGDLLLSREVGILGAVTERGE